MNRFLLEIGKVERGFPALLLAIEVADALNGRAQQIEQITIPLGEPLSLQTWSNVILEFPGRAVLGDPVQMNTGQGTENREVMRGKCRRKRQEPRCPFA